jgi:hypothetical protein
MTKAVIAFGLIFGAILFVLFFSVVSEMAKGDAQIAATRENTNTIFAQYQSGVHRFYGEIRLPHSCYLLTRKAIMDTKDPTVVYVDITTTDKSSESNSCSRVMTRYLFDVIQEGEENLNPKLRVDGVVLPSNVVRKSWGTGKEVIIGSDAAY